jgi:hypothetical protein
MRNVILFALILLFGFSCEFPLEKETFVEISPIPKSDVEINLGNLPDTLKVIEDINITYSLKLSGSPAIAVFIAIGNQVQYLGYSRNGTFRLSSINNDVINAGGGYVPFEFAVYSTSSTGSMADRAQRELLLFSMNRTLYYDYTPPSAVNFTKVEEKEGSIFLSWSEYPHPNLRSLKLRRTSINYGSNTPTTDIITLPSTSTSHHDQAFLSGEVEYQIITENNLGNKSSGSVARFVSSPSTIVEFKTIGANQLEIKWNKTRFYNNSVGYRITREGYATTLFTTTNPSDTTAILNNIPFGTAVKLNLQTLSTSPPLNATTTKSVWIGRRIPKPLQIFYDQPSDSFYYLNLPYLVKEDNTSKRDSAKFDFNENGLSQISTNGLDIFIPSDRTVNEISTADLTRVNTYTIPDEFYSTVPFKTNFITAIPLFSSYSLIRVYDQATGVIVQQYGFSSSKLISRLYLTKNPEYLIGEGSEVCLFRLNSNGTILSEKCVSGDFSIMSRDGNFIYVFNQNTFTRSKYTFPNFELVPGSEKTLYFQYNTPFDRTLGFVASATSDKLDLIDIETLTLTKSIPIDGTYLNPENIRLSGGVVFINNGEWTYALKVQ